MDEDTVLNQNQINTPSLESPNHSNSTNETSRESSRTQLNQNNDEESLNADNDIDIDDDDDSGNNNNNNGTNGNTVSDRNIIFRTIINEIDGPDKNGWMLALCEKICRRFKRMPKGWWQKINQEFNTKFELTWNLPEVKNLYTRMKRQINVTTNNDSNIDDSTEPTPQQIKNAALYVKVRDMLRTNISIFNNSDEPKTRTRKIYSQDENNDVIEMINLVIQSDNIQEKINNIREYNNCIYACQVTYEKATEKIKKDSNWKDAIQNKIKKLQDELKVVNNHDQKKKPTKEMTKICRKNNIHSNDNDKVQLLKDHLIETINIYEKKLSIAGKRATFRNTNKQFEFNRRIFYKNLESERIQIDPSINMDETRNFWENIWKEQDVENDYESLIGTLTPIEHQIDMSNEKIMKIVESTISHLPNWKTPGHEQVYNYFIKKIHTLHNKLQRLVAEIIQDPKRLDEEFYIGTTYLIPKQQSTAHPKDTRPITCLPNIYKLVSKCVTELFNEICEVNGVLSDNQMGTKSRCQGAKEQALVNKNLNSKHDNKLYTSWVDVKKAYDSVRHDYLVDCIQSLNIPVNLINFVKRTLSLQKTTLMCNRNSLGTVRMERGIIQGDALSPKLFVIAMEPLSRVLNTNCDKLSINENNDIRRNHLIFIDDVKMLAKDENTLIDLCLNAKNCFSKMGLEVNETKSSSNITSEYTFGEELDNEKGYKYLGVLENSQNVVKEENKTIIREKIFDRARKICKTKLNAKNLFHAINEFALSTANYYIGIVPFEPKEFEEIDSEIKRILSEHRITRKSSNIDRLYLKRDFFGRGLKNLAEKSEVMLYSLSAYLRERMDKRPLADNEKQEATHLGLINEYLQMKYDLREDDISVKTIQQKQHERRMNKIKDKKLHGVIFENEDGKVDVRDSSTWLKHGNISPQEEGMLCGVQDRNLFYHHQRCSHCNQANKTVDHLATQCGRMLNSDYKKRHNDVVRCLHFLFTKKYGLNKRKKLKNYQVESVVSNERVRIKSDVTIQTELRIEHNKPDLLVHDLQTNEITIIEVGITSKRNLSTVEVTKGRKYDLLGKELSMLNGGAKITLIPVVITWDGLVTKYFKKYMGMLNVGKRLQAYIQGLVVKRTCESVMIDYRNQQDDGSIEELETIFDRADL